MVHLMSITIRVTLNKSIMETPHKHHIVPTYKCIELGLTTSYKIGGKEFYFKENMVEVPREHHALIHWGYWCNDLKPLLEVCNPPKWVIDMIPLEDIRDSAASTIIALGEIDEIDMSGENNPMFGKTGKNNPNYGSQRSEETKKKMSGENHWNWKGGIDSKTYEKKRNSTPERKVYKKAYNKTYNQIPEYKAYRKAYDRARYLRKKLEKQQGQGTLEQHIG